MLRAEYGAGPIWDDDWDGARDLTPAPETLGLSDELCDALRRWQADYDATLDQAYPPDSSFATDDERTAWRQRGYELFRWVQVELGEMTVVRLALPDR